MTWTTYFNSSSNPALFDPSVDYLTLNGFQQPQFEAFMSKVIQKLNEEARLINPNAVYDQRQVRTITAQNWDSLTYLQKFQTITQNAETILNQEKNNTLTTSNINAFYKKYYFRQPTQKEIEALQANPYGLGATTEYNLKTQAIGYLADNGIINRSEYESLPVEEQLAKLEGFTSDANQIRATALRLNNGIIDEEKVELRPDDAIGALVRLKNRGHAVLKSDGTYAYAEGKGVDQLAELNNGNWLTSYQKLEKQWRESGSTDSFASYLAQQQSFRSEIDRVRISKTSDYALELSNTLDKTLAEKIAAEVGSPEARLSEIENKIQKLKADAYQQAYNQLNIYKARDEQQRNMDSMLSNSMSSISNELSQDFGLKSDFFKVGGLNSSANYSWQKWFEDELSKRYDPNNPNNRVRSILGGASKEDIDIASSFMSTFLRQRFDGSKSLSEFTSYIDPNAKTPLLEKDSNVAWNQFSSDNYYSLLGAITDPNSNLGNFWNLLQTSWREGVGFDTSFYKDQEVVDSNNKTQTVENLWSGLKAVHAIALNKNTTNLKPEDFSEEDKAAMGISTDQELTNKINEYRAWSNRAFEYGSDIEDLEQFMKMHYNVYRQDVLSGSATNLVVPASGQLRVNSPEALKEEDKTKIQNMAEKLAFEATKYISQIQYGQFMTPEEYVSNMLGNKDISSIFGNTMLEGSSETDILKDFTNEFAGVVSSYAGEQIRNNIRMLIQQNQIPNQELLGVDYIQRTKEQALSTIRNIINKQAKGSAVIASNINAPAPGESLGEWFRKLGLEIVPGDTWEKFKSANNISSDLSFEEWEKYYSHQSSSSGGTLGQDFWNQWTRANGISMGVADGKINLVITNPSSAWRTWGNSIVDSVQAKNSAIISALDGASVEVKTNELNKGWYSSTNPYTKVLDDWKKASRTPTNKIINISGTSAWKWAKDNQIDPAGAWNNYVTEKRKTSPRFAKDAAGDDMSFQDWAASVKSFEVDSFWKSTNSYWIQYLKDQGIATSSSTENNLQVKTWSEWASANNIDLEALKTTTSKDSIPSAFLDLHYNLLGGKSRVDKEYLNVYFPEFEALEKKTATSYDTPFDLSSFGLDPIDTNSSNLLKDFDQFDPFKSISGDFGFDITNPSSVDTFDSKNTVDLKGDMNFGTGINTLTKKRTNTQYTQNFDGNFEGFGGFDFGF